MVSDFLPVVSHSARSLETRFVPLDFVRFDAGSCILPMSNFTVYPYIYMIGARICLSHLFVNFTRTHLHPCSDVYHKLTCVERNTFSFRSQLSGGVIV